MKKSFKSVIDQVLRIISSNLQVLTLISSNLQVLTLRCVIFTIQRMSNTQACCSRSYARRRNTNRCFPEKRPAPLPPPPPHQEMSAPRIPKNRFFCRTGLAHRPKSRHGVDLPRSSTRDPVHWDRPI